MKIPGQSGFAVKKYSSRDNRILGKFTDVNHLSSIADISPDQYDKDYIELFSQTRLYSNDFTDMINRSETYWISGDSWTWKLKMPYQPNEIVRVPTATATNPAVGRDESIFELVFTRPFQKNDIITSDKRWGDTFIVVADPSPEGEHFLIALRLIGENVTNTTVAQEKFLQVGVAYEKIDNLVGEFTQNLTGLDGFGDELVLIESMASAYGAEHTVTKWADQLAASIQGGGVRKDVRFERNSEGHPLDLIVYAKYAMGETGEKKVVDMRWESFIDAELRKEVLRMRTKRMIWGQGGHSQEIGQQDVKKAALGIYKRIRDFGHYIPYNKGTLSVNLLRQAIGDLFYRRVEVDKRRAKLYTNEAGLAAFRNMTREDLMANGLNITMDIMDYGKNPKVAYPGFDMVFTHETGEIVVVHLKELDEPQSKIDYELNRKTPPIFFIFDITNPDGGLQNIREVRMKGAPSMTWGYINGRQHYLGHAASRGMESASMDPGYKIWYEDRTDIHIEDLSRCVIIEEQPQYMA